jgi:hypothetical protein
MSGQRSVLEYYDPSKRRSLFTGRNGVHIAENFEEDPVEGQGISQPVE